MIPDPNSGVIRTGFERVQVVGVEIAVNAVNRRDLLGALSLLGEGERPATRVILQCYLPSCSCIEPIWVFSASFSFLSSIM